MGQELALRGQAGLRLLAAAAERLRLRLDHLELSAFGWNTQARGGGRSVRAFEQIRCPLAPAFSSIPSRPSFDEPDGQHVGLVRTAVALGGLAVRPHITLRVLSWKK